MRAGAVPLLPRLLPRLLPLLLLLTLAAVGGAVELEACGASAADEPCVGAVAPQLRPSPPPASLRSSLPAASAASAPPSLSSPSPALLSIRSTSASTSSSLLSSLSSSASSPPTLRSPREPPAVPQPNEPGDARHLVVGVLSARDHFSRRAVLRETWVGDARRRGVLVRFIVGADACPVPPQLRTDPYGCSDTDSVQMDASSAVTDDGHGHDRDDGVDMAFVALDVPDAVLHCDAFGASETAAGADGAGADRGDTLASSTMCARDPSTTAANGADADASGAKDAGRPGRTGIGPVGVDFVVRSPIVVTHLGAFDGAGDGFVHTINVSLLLVDPVELIASAIFTRDDPGERRGAFRFKELNPRLLMTRGLHASIVASGFGADDPACDGPDAHHGFVDDGDGLIAVEPLSRTGAPTAPFVAGPHSFRHAAGTFIYMAERTLAADGTRAPVAAARAC